MECFVDTGHATIDEIFGNFCPKLGRFTSQNSIQYKYPLVVKHEEDQKMLHKNDNHTKNDKIISESAQIINTITRRILRESYESLEDMLHTMSEKLKAHEVNLLCKIRTQIESTLLEEETSSSLQQCFDSVESLIRVYVILERSLYLYVSIYFTHTHTHTHILQIRKIGFAH